MDTSYSSCVRPAYAPASRALKLWARSGCFGLWGAALLVTGPATAKMEQDPFEATLNDISPRPSAAEAQADTQPESEAVEVSDLAVDSVPAPTVQAPPELSSSKTARRPRAKKSTGERKHMRFVKIPRTGKTQMFARLASFSEYFGNNYNGRDNDDGFVAHVNQLSLGARTNFRKWSMQQSVRIDTHHVFGTKGDEGIYLCDIDGDGEVTVNESERCSYRWDYRLERFTSRFDFRKFAITLGDFNVNFGRGVGLSVRKIASIGIDATIKGARLEFKTKYLEGSALLGMANGQHSDFSTRRLVPDPGYAAGRCEREDGQKTFRNRNFAGNPLWSTCSDFILGGHLLGKLPGKIRLGAHYTRFDFGVIGGGVLPEEKERLHLFGGDVARARIGGFWDLFIGAVGLVRNPHLPVDNGNRYRGLGIYTQHNIDVRNTLITLEGKYYDNYYVQSGPQGLSYVEAPTAERADQQVNGTFNTAGGRIQVDRIWRPQGLTLFANMMAYAYAVNPTDDTFDRGEKGYIAVHPFAGLRWNKPNSAVKVQVSGGYRHEAHNASPDDTPDLLARKFPHAEFYISLPVGEAGGFAHSLGFRGEFRRETKRVEFGEDNKFVRGNVILEYSMSPYLNISFIGGFSSEFVGVEGEPALEAKPCEQDEDGNYLCLRKPHLWPGAEIRFNFLGTSFIRLFMGRQVGGRICVNGSCRDLPDFEGIRGELNLSF